MKYTFINIIMYSGYDDRCFLQLQLPDSEPAGQPSCSSDLSVDTVSVRASSPSDASQCSDEVNSIAVIGYPAPVPSFSRPIAQVLADGNKSKVMLLYSDIVKEASAFYSAICPSETSAAKQSMMNIGKTLIDSFPALAVADHQNPWTYFNDKLSSALRNARCRLKRKLASPSAAASAPKSFRVVQPVVHELSEELYKKHVAELKREACKSKPDVNHMKFLLQQTHHNRRAWIDSKPSAELRLATVVDEYPCFRIPDVVLEEFRLFKGAAVVDNFTGWFSTSVYTFCPQY